MKRLLIAAVCGIGITRRCRPCMRPIRPCARTCFADVGWSDIAATTGLASTMLQAGYSPTKTIASVPITFAGIKSKQIDVFLGYWSPTMDPIIQPFTKAGQIKVLSTPNLTGAKYTLAVPDYVPGRPEVVRGYSEVRGQAERQDLRIEPGNDGNLLIKR